MNELALPNAIDTIQLVKGDAATAGFLSVPGVKLGQATNLVLGLRPGWTVDAGAAGPFFAPRTAPLSQTEVPIIPKTDEKWGLPAITLHETTESLLSAVYPYTVKALAGTSGTFSVPAGALMAGDLDRAEVLKSLSETLGVDLTKGYKYMLVTVTRSVGRAKGTYTAGAGGAAGSSLTAEAQEVVDALPG